MYICIDIYTYSRHHVQLHNRIPKHATLNITCSIKLGASIPWNRLLGQCSTCSWINSVVGTESTFVCRS